MENIQQSNPLAEVLIELKYIRKELEEIKQAQKTLFKLQEELAVVKHQIDVLEDQVEYLEQNTSQRDARKESFVMDIIKLFISFVLGLITTLLFFKQKT